MNEDNVTDVNNNDVEVTCDYLKCIYSAKRKRSVCRLLAVTNINDILVNAKPLCEYFDNVQHWISRITGVIHIFELDKMGFKCNVYGGGKMAQSDSIRYALGKFLRDHLKYIYANDTAALKEKVKLLKLHKLTTVDTRIVECKKYGLKKARKRRQRSKR